MPTHLLSSWAKLAEALSVSRQSVSRWRKMPGAPETPDLDEWQIFVTENDLGLGGNLSSEDKTELVKEKLRTDIDIAKVKLEKERGRLIDRNMVDGFLARYEVIWQSRGRSRFVNEIQPKLEGLGPAERREVCKREWAEFCAEIKEVVESWQDGQ